MIAPPSENWFRRDLPVLRAVAELIDERPGVLIRRASIIERSGFSDEDVTRALASLERGQLLEVTWSRDFEGEAIEWVNSMTGAAHRAVGFWPTPESAADRLIAALDQIAENTDDEDTRTRVEKVRTALGGLSRELIVSVAGAAAGVAMQ